MVELSSCKDDEERVGWLEAIVITATNVEGAISTTIYP